MEDSKKIKKFFWISAGIACISFAIVCLALAALFAYEML